MKKICIHNGLEEFDHNKFKSPTNNYLQIMIALTFLLKFMEFNDKTVLYYMRYFIKVFVELDDLTEYYKYLNESLQYMSEDDLLLVCNNM